MCEENSHTHWSHRYLVFYLSLIDPPLSHLMKRQHSQSRQCDFVVCTIELSIGVPLVAQLSPVQANSFDGGRTEGGWEVDADSLSARLRTTGLDGQLTMHVLTRCHFFVCDCHR